MVLVRTTSVIDPVLTSTHDLYFEQKYKDYHNFSYENYHFYSLEKSQYIASTCYCIDGMMVYLHQHNFLEMLLSKDSISHTK